MKKTTLRNHNLPLSYYHNCNDHYYATVLEVTATISDHEHLSKPPQPPPSPPSVYRWLSYYF